MKDAWRSFPVMSVALAVAAVSALGLAYWSNVKDREHYLQSRNFRLLAVLARQTEQVIENRSRVFKEQVATALHRGIEPTGKWRAWPSLVSRDSERINPALHELAGGEVRVTVRTDPKHFSRYTSRTGSDGSHLQFDWFPGEPAKDENAPVGVRVPAGETLHGIFDAKLNQGAFDTVLLTDEGGQLVYAAGRRTTEVRATSVRALLPGGSQSGQPGTAIVDSISETRVRIAGVDYRMFVQPCCQTAGGSPAFLVVGLVEDRAMFEASLAISPVLVLAGSVLVIGLLVGWSFLKVALIGSQQRVTRVDVLQLGASGIFGLALATILLLTTSAYARLSADVDAQLEQLADRLDERFTLEVDSAARQLSGMADAFSSYACTGTASDSKSVPSRGDPCMPMTSPWSGWDDLPPELRQGYSAFTAFALLDESGFQRVKVAFQRSVKRRVDVSDRSYFHQARSEEGLWKIASCPNGCFLESHWSWTTGKPQVVLSMPTESDTLPVAALSIPMQPLLEPVLPPGFEFALIDQNGQVHFHSDPQRNVHENLLLETDGNRRLHSLVTTHGAGTVNTSYWGRPYRAYVRPTLIPGWSIVALHAKQPARALVLEWSAVALLMQSGYMLIWIALTVLLMTSRASWLWPDPLRRPWYLALAIVYGVALVVWIAFATQAEPMTVVWTGLSLPPALWGLTCIVLMNRPNDVGQPKAWSHLCRDYRLAAALLLAITAAVPATAIFTLSSSLHLDAFLKEQQITLARSVERTLHCGGQQGPSAEDLRYDSVFYRSRVQCDDTPFESMTTPDRRNVHPKYEDYVPYFTPASVALRELMHERSDDDAWRTHYSTGGLAVTVRGQEPHSRIEVWSERLPILGVYSLGDAPQFVRTAAVSLLMLGGVAFGAYWIVGYLLRRVVLADVVPPVCTNGHVVTSPGQHVLVICEQPAALAQELKDDLIRPLMPIVTASNVANAWRQARRALSEIGPMQRIVIPDLDEQSDDLALMRRKLELLDDLMAELDVTVLLLTTMSKRALAATVRDSWRWSQEPERWSKVLARLTVVNKRPAGDPGGNRAGSTTRAAWWCELQALIRERMDNLKRQWTGAREHRDWRKDLLDAEAAACQAVEPFCRDLEGTPAFKAGLPTRDQILEELEERASSIYRNLWQSCDEDERVILEHVARHGLASAASRRVVRRLLARGLLRKDPELRLMNCSFRRFVLEAECRSEVVALERQAGPSLWDRLRFPLGMAAVIAVVFLAITQREAFDATLTMAAGVTTAVPTLAKLMTVLAQFTAKGNEGKVNA